MSPILMSQNQKLVKRLEGIYNLSTEWLAYIEEDAEVDDALRLALGQITELALNAMRNYQTGEDLKAT